MANAPGWWGERFLQYLLAEAVLPGPPTRSQIKGAERGEARISFERGAISAVVGSGQPHTATLKIKPLTEREWKKAVAAIAADPEIARRLLSGTPGAELERVLAAAGIALFPPVKEAASRCNCWDPWECRHMRVLAVRSAKLLDASPFLWLEVLGRPREAVLAAVRAALTDLAGAENAAPLVSAERFLTTETDPDAISVAPGTTSAPDALLKLLGPLPLPEQFRRISWYLHSWQAISETADAVVARYVARISQEAAGLAAGDRAPVYGDDAPAGKRVPLKHRLIPEITEAVAAADTALSLAQLHGLCPTAATHDFSVAEPALEDALELLGPEFLTLGGEYVGLRSAILTGARFRHVITLTEWRARRLSSGADWERVLAAAGFTPPFAIHAGGVECRVLGAQDDLFAQLHPEVGDELQLTVTDPEGPVLTGTLVRCDERSQAGLLEEDRAAAQTVSQYISDRQVWAIAEAQAVELLLANGFYREGRSPDPVWLLPAAATATAARNLSWGRDRLLTVHSWYASEPSLGRPAGAAWPERAAVLSHFVIDLTKAGHRPREIGLALDCIEAWCRVWPGDQSSPGRRPTLGALAHFLWNVAPVQFRGAGDAPLAAMAAWFRFLAERYPAVRGAFGEHLALCELAPAYARRVKTLPGAHSRDAMTAWLLEGYRWLGPELLFGES